MTRDMTVRVEQDPTVSCAGGHVTMAGFPTPGAALGWDAIALHVADVATGEWAAIAKPSLIPLTDARLAVGLIAPAMWTGTELVFPESNVAYNFEQGTWREVDVQPKERAGLVWTGTAIAGYVPGEAQGTEAEVFVYPLN